jgi:hypothetical protein
MLEQPKEKALRDLPIYQRPERAIFNSAGCRPAVKKDLGN